MHAVHLEGSRCDGAAHGGCGAQCLMFWKGAWLERTVGGETSSATMGSGSLRATRLLCSSNGTQLLATTIRQPVQGSEAGDVYRCQATELRNAATALSSLDLSQYVRDVRSGNIRVGAILSALAFRSYQRLLKLRGFRIWFAKYELDSKTSWRCSLPVQTRSISS